MNEALSSNLGGLKRTQFRINCSGKLSKPVAFQPNNAVTFQVETCASEAASSEPLRIVIKNV